MENKEKKITDILVVYEDGEMEIVYHTGNSMLNSFGDKDRGKSWGGFEFLKDYEEFFEAMNEKKD
jgi:hypothetical protein